MKYIDWVSLKKDKCTLKDMKEYLDSAQSKTFSKGCIIKGKNRSGTFNYILSANPAQTAKALRCTYKLKSGKSRIFAPHLHPKEMLALGVFEGKMINDCMDEFPHAWFSEALTKNKLSPSKPDVNCNLYQIKSRQSLHEWKRKKWIIGADDRGWFQWFCRYALGRRDTEIDTKQMKRWASIARWYGTLKKDPTRTIIRQTLLQWSWPHEDFS